MNDNNDTRTPAELQEWLSEVEQRAEKATPGRLFVSDNEEGWRVDADADEWDDESDRGPYPDGALMYGWYREDLELFVEARTDIPRLVQELRRAWARIEDCYKAIGELVDREAKAEEAMLAPTPYLDKVSTERTAATLKQYGIDWPAEQEAPHD